MKTRGRPRHPETLTPRQQDVLALLRQGLTNEEIAQRLDISLDGAKYHVSDILRRLQVDSRYEAASWKPEPAARQWAWAFGPLAFFSKLNARTIGQAAGGGVLVAAAVGVSLLAWGVLRSSDSGASVDDTQLLVHLSRATIDATTWNIGVYDPDVGRNIASFPVSSTPSGGAPKIAASSKYVFVNLADRVMRYNLDGSGGLQLRTTATGDGVPGEPYILDIALSPDGEKLSLTEQTADLCPQQIDPDVVVICNPYREATSIVVLNISNGEELTRVDQSHPGFDNFAGQAWQMTWIDEDDMIVTGATQSEAPGGLAWVSLRGTVDLLESATYDRVSPDGRYRVGGEFQLCDLGSPPEQHELVVNAVDGGHRLLSLEDPIDNFRFVEWSPDSREVLYSTYRLRSNADGCRQSDATTIRHFIAPIDGSSPPRPVRDPLAAQIEWYGVDNTLTYQCLGERMVQSYCARSSGEPVSVDAFVGTKKIASGFDLQIVRAISPPPVGGAASLQGLFISPGDELPPWQ